jgi:hypothetical protein
MINTIEFHQTRYVAKLKDEYKGELHPPFTTVELGKWYRVSVGVEMEGPDGMHIYYKLGDTNAVWPVYALDFKKGKITYE